MKPLNAHGYGCSLKIFSVLFILFFFFSFALLAQEAAAEESAQYETLLDYFATIPGLAALTLLLTAWFKNFLKDKTAWLTWLFTDNRTFFVAIGLSLILSAVGFIFQYGIFIGVAWYFIFVYGGAAGLLASGFFDWKLLKSILEFLKLLPKGNK